MITRILFLGSLRDQAGGGERIVEIPQGVSTLASLIDFVSADDEALKTALLAPSVRIAIDQEIMIDRKEPLRRAEEIAFMPPFSGG